MSFRRAMTGALAALAVTSCQQSPQPPKPTLHEVMTGTIDPVADVIWTESSKAYGDDGEARAGILTDAEWSAIAKAGRDLHDGARIIIANPDIEVARPGVKILDEGKVPEAVTAAQVESYVDRDRPGLADQAKQLSAIALQIEAAAKARDAARTVKLSEDLDEVCEACHQRFWYPDQKALIDYKNSRTDPG